MNPYKFFSIVISCIILVTVIECTMYNNTQSNTETIDADYQSQTDTLQRGVLSIVAVNNIGDTIKTVINTTDYYSHDNMVDGVGNSSTSWHSATNDYSIKTTNSQLMYLTKVGEINWYGWYEIIEVTYEIK